MAPTDKYKSLIDFARNSGVKDLTVNEENGILYITGMTSPDIKEKMWNMYSDIDPDMRGADLIMNIKEDGSSSAGNENIYEIKAGDNLSKIAKMYPNMTWQKIFEANKDIIKDPNKIFPGQKIRIPL